MRVRGLRAAQPSPARSVTQSRRLAGACAEFQGLLWGGSRAPCAGCSLPCTYSCQAWADAGDVALSEVLSASGTFLECSRIHSHSSGCHCARRRPVEDVARPAAQGREPPGQLHSR